MSIMDRFYTYIYYDPSRSNEPIYVGKGTGIRAWKHLQRKDTHPFTQRLQKMKRNGIEPVIGIYAGLDHEFALFLEEELIQHFGRKDLGKGSLLNRSDGGEGGGTNKKHNSPSVETKKKLSESNKGKHNFKHTEESLQKIRAAGKRKKSPEECAKLKEAWARRKASGWVKPKLTEEQRMKLSQAVKKSWADPLSGLNHRGDKS